LPRSEIVEVLLKLSSQKLTAGELIAERVRAECDDVAGKWKSCLIELSPDEVKLNSEVKARAPYFEPQNRVTDALAAFNANAFVLLVDDEQIETLEQEITMTPTSVVTFLKLTPLVGG
ncbi:unnamed protein product, partial [Ectocarpus sp. 12 AP-2014]